MNFSPKAKGDPVYAEEWNALVGQLLATRSRIAKLERTIGVGGGPLQEPAIRARVQNATGGVLSARSVVAMKDQVGIADEAARERRVLTGETPTADDAGRWAITSRGAAEDEVIDAYISGVCLCDVDVTDETHTYAEVSTVTTHLVSASTGTARIIDREGGTGVQWAVISFPSGSGGGSSNTARPARIEAALEGSADLAYSVKLWDVVTEDVTGAAFDAYPLQADLLYGIGQIVEVFYDPTASVWVIDGQLGTHETPAELVGSGASADTTTWDVTAQGANDGMDFRGYRVAYSSDDHALYGFGRTLDIDSLGLAAEGNAESAEQILPAGSDASPVDLVADSDAADTTDWDIGDGAVQALLGRVKWVSADNALYWYQRNLLANDLGFTDDVSAETRSEINPGTYSFPTSLTGSGETADAGTWARSSATDGVSVPVQTRNEYNEAGDEILYGYYRTWTFDSWGRLRTISAETRYTIDTPVDECT